MGRRSSLGKVIVRYSLLELFYTFFLILFFFIIIDLSINMGIFYRADYAQSQVKVVKERMQKKDWNIEELPYYFDYQVIENGHNQQTIPSKYNTYIERAKIDGKSRTGDFVAPYYFEYEKNAYREVVLSYQMSLIFTNKTLYQLVPNAEMLSSLFFIGLWVMGFLGFVRQCVRRIQHEFMKVTRTNEAIRQMNLDYRREYSSYKEIQGILDSLDSMSQELKKSLTKQWQSQQKQKELVQSVTHDIRTPITLIKGHLELLKEELDEKEYPSLYSLGKGVYRLEQYIDQLKKISLFSTEKKHSVNTKVLEEWIELAEDLAHHTNHSICIKQQDTSAIFIDKEQVTRALQNVIVNSLEHSASETTLFLIFKDDPDYYRIIIEDEGTGFSKEALIHATERFYTTKTTQKYRGLGLSITQEILLNYQGFLSIKNTENGASVTLKLKK